MSRAVAAAAGVAITAGCMAPGPAGQGPKATAGSTNHATQAGVAAMLAPWSGPHGGLPAFAQVDVGAFVAAFDVAIASDRAEVAAITAQAEPASFDNTMLALERSGASLNRLRTYYDVWSSSLSSSPMQAVEQTMEPKLAAHRDEVNQDAKLFARINAIASSPGFAQLKPEQQRLVQVYRTEMIKNGAQLGPEAKARVREINQQLAKLYTQFSQNLLADEGRAAAIVDDRSRLAGLPEADIAAAAATAEQMGHKGQWAIANTRSAVESVLTLADDRALREQVFHAFVSRGDHAASGDNKPLISQMLALRTERSRLLGFPSFAHWQLSDSMAQEPARAMALIEQVWQPAVARMNAQIEQMQAMVRAQGKDFTIAAWDTRYYAEKLRKAQYDFDTAALTPYLQLAKIQSAMFWAAKTLYNLDFTPVSGAQVFHPDVTVWEVRRDGQHVGYWYFDPFARQGKRSGAWMSSYRAQGRVDPDGPTTPIVSNNSNFKPGQPGEPVFTTWDDAVTMFHEFGHALHGLVSNVTYPKLAGTNVVADFGEFPSQVMEYWITTPQVLRQFTNIKGESLPPAMIEKLQRSHQFDAPFTKVEYLASAYLDMAIHLAAGQNRDIDPATFEQQQLAKLGMPAAVVARHRLPQFGHVFSGEDYAAGYYNYLWAEVIARDAYAAFVDTGNPWDPATARRYHDSVLSVGNTVDAGEAYRRFRGRDATVDALLKAEGFSAP